MHSCVASLVSNQTFGTFWYTCIAFYFSFEYPNYPNTPIKTGNAIALDTDHPVNRSSAISMENLSNEYPIVYKVNDS